MMISQRRFFISRLKHRYAKKPLIEAVIVIPIQMPSTPKAWAREYDIGIRSALHPMLTTN